MSPELSLYLDLIRVVAAFLVVLAHLNLRALTAEIPTASGYGHSAVIVFFVLSGYVIAHVVDSRETRPRAYVASRMARIYSVLVPALVLSIVLDSAGRYLSPAVYAGQTTVDMWWLRAAATLSFMNEPWGISIQAFSAPFWSVAYEVWYYILFGVYTFWRGTGRGVALALAAMLAGPKVLLLMPVWLLGVWLCRSNALSRIPWQPAALMCGVSIALIVGFHAADGPQYFRAVVANLVGASFQAERMTWSGEFLGDYILGLLVALNFLTFRACAPMAGSWLRLVAKPVRWCAGYTFSLYLFHRPLILFYTALIHGSPRSNAFYYQVVALVLISVFALGAITEHRKKWFRNVIERALASGLGAVAPSASQAAV